jgi:tungstate transport system substrate-binding protein
MRWLGVIALIGSVIASPGCGDTDSNHVRLATTTSTANSGLLDWLLPPFEETTGYMVDVIPVGTGRALALGRNGDADLVLVHARSREDRFISDGFGVDRRDVMWNDFVILGPPADPAGVKGMASAGTALARIAEQGASFISRDDDSGTHTREQQLWASAGGRPEFAPGAYVEAGQGMGHCLNIADEKRAYVLSDRGTFLAYRGKLDLVVLVEGDPALINPYGAILVNPERHEGLNADGARTLLDYLTSPEGQARIAAFRIGDEVLFHPVSAKE